MSSARSSLPLGCGFSAVLALLAAGCAPAFDPVTELKTLRVLGVQKDKPYAKLGETVTLRMLWHDGSPDLPRDVKRAWLVAPGPSGELLPCVNPPGDLYYACFGQFAAAVSALNGGVLPQEPFEIPLPDTDEVTVGLEDFNDENGAGIYVPRGPGQPAYGLAYVFFAVCAGERFVFDFSLLPGLPFSCLDANGGAVGPEGFVAGYSAIYAFENQYENKNPVISGFKFQGAEVTPDCTGAACIGLPIMEPDCSVPGTACVQACPEDGEPECDEYKIEAVVDRSSVEDDVVSREVYNAAFQEQLWTSVYVDHGSVAPAVKLVNDAVTGWNDKQELDFRAPKATGPVAIWAVVHDNRGGAEFVRFTVKVE